MKFTIKRDAVEIDYKSSVFWQQFDEIEVENPNGWYIRYISGGIVHVFEYSQSTGRGEYCDEYRDTVCKVPLNFTDDPKTNADIMRRTNYDNKKAVLVREL